MLWLRCGRNLSELQNNFGNTQCMAIPLHTKNCRTHKSTLNGCLLLVYLMSTARCRQEAGTKRDGQIKKFQKREFYLSFQKSRVMLLKTDERSVRKWNTLIPTTRKNVPPVNIGAGAGRLTELVPQSLITRMICAAYAMATAAAQAAITSGQMLIASIL